MSESVGSGVFRRRSRAEAEGLVSEYVSSGLTRKEFSVLRGLSLHTLDAYRRRHQQRAGSSGIVPVELVEPSPMTSARPARASLSVLLPGGVRIEVGAEFDAVVLRKLIAALGS